MKNRQKNNSVILRIPIKGRAVGTSNSGEKR